MYGLPADFDAAFLVELTLIQVCIGENEVLLRFTDESHPSGIVTVIVTADVVVGHRSETVCHLDTWEHYESYVIEAADQTVVV